MKRHVVKLIITFRVRRSRCEMYIGHDRLRVCLSLAAFPLYCTDPDVAWAMVGGALWADLQSVHGFRCYDNIAPNANCQRVLVLHRSMPGFHCEQSVYSLGKGSEMIG